MSSSDVEPRALVVPHPSGHTGTLRTARGREVPVRTYDEGEEVVLIVLTAVDAPLADSELDPSTLEYTSRRGVVRLRGEARFANPSSIRFRAGSQAEVIQRRAFVRVHAPQEVTLADATTEGHRAYTIDVSGGGMLLSGAAVLRPGDAVAFEIHLGEEIRPIAGVARVVRAHDDGRRALAFEEIEETERQRLIRFVFACLRESRAKTRGDLA